MPDSASLIIENVGNDVVSAALERFVRIEGVVEVERALGSATICSGHLSSCKLEHAWLICLANEKLHRATAASRAAALAMLAQ